MVPVLITSNRSKAGKVFFIIGLAQNLMQQGYNVGYIKPLGTIPIKRDLTFTTKTQSSSRQR
jgi:BioD-like phosphotransacetylase family protein